MKMYSWLILGVMAATSAMAQNNTNSLPPIPAPAIDIPAAVPAPAVTNAPAHKPKPVVKHKKKLVAKKIAEAPVTLVPGPATVDAANVNIRGQAGLKGEVIEHLKKGDAVTVLAQINLDKHAVDEPAQWAKIALPADLKVWVNGKFLDATNKTVASKKLNLRAGPGENYSVLGVLTRGTAISEVIAKGDWIQIDAPSNAFAFIDAAYLKQEAPPVVAALSGPAPAPMPVAATAEPNTVAEPPAIVTQPATPSTPAVDTTAAPAPAPVPAAPIMPAMVTPAVPPAVDTNLPPPPPRVVTHEGYVRHSVSVVAPTYFELYDPATSRAINYLYTTTTNLNIGRYNGFQIVVTGEEGLDSRWQDTPVLTVQRIYVLSTNAPSATP